MSLQNRSSRAPFVLALVIIATASHGVLSCDSDACHIGSSGAMATGCTVGATVGGIASGVACTAGAVFTFGLSCAIALGATAAVAGGCAAGEIALSNACDNCAPGTGSILDIADKIDQSKLEIMEQQRNSSNEIIDKISILKEASKSWFQQLNANDQNLVSNQIDLLCQQKSSNDMLRALIETTDSLVTEVIETQIIAEYAAPLNNMANIARLYNRIRKGAFGLIMTGTVLVNFKARALRTDKDGLYDSIDLTFQLLLGKGSHFHDGKSVFEYQPSYCSDDIYSYFIGRLSEAMNMYKVALKMNSQEISVNTHKDWTENFALVQEAYGRHCGCPKDFQFEHTKKISEIFDRLPAAEQNLQEIYRSTSLLSRNLLTRQKITLLLDVKTFDITDQNLNIIEDYTMEDILLATELKKTGQFDKLAKVYEGIGKCVSVPYHLEAEKTIKYGGEVQVSKGLKRPDVFYNWGYQYIIQFNIEINQDFDPTWLNVFRITSSDSNIGNHGDRVPALFVNKDKTFYFSTSLGGDANHHFRFEYELNKQYDIAIIQTEISQRYNRDKVMFCIQIDGKLVHCKENERPRKFHVVQLYTSDRFHDALTPYGKIGSLTITKYVDKLLQDTLKLDGDVAIDKGLLRNEVFRGWGKQYLVEFTIEVNRLPSQSTNVFHMTSNGNDCRIPAVFVSEEKHFHITASVGGNGNFYHNYNFELNTLYHVKIKQEKMVGSTSGNFSIWINDKYILFKENDQLKIFHYVSLYLSDPWHSSFKSYGKLTDLKLTNLGMEKHYLEEKILRYNL